MPKGPATSIEATTTSTQNAMTISGAKHTNSEDINMSGIFDMPVTPTKDREKTTLKSSYITNVPVTPTNKKRHASDQYPSPPPTLNKIRVVNSRTNSHMSSGAGKESDKEKAILETSKKIRIRVINSGSNGPVSSGAGKVAREAESITSILTEAEKLEDIRKAEIITGGLTETEKLDSHRRAKEYFDNWKSTQEAKGWESNHDGDEDVDGDDEGQKIQAVQKVRYCVPTPSMPLSPPSSPPKHIKDVTWSKPNPKTGKYDINYPEYRVYGIPIPECTIVKKHYLNKRLCPQIYWAGPEARMWMHRKLTSYNRVRYFWLTEDAGCHFPGLDNKSRSTAIIFHQELQCPWVRDWVAKLVGVEAYMEIIEALDEHVEYLRARAEKEALEAEAEDENVDEE